MSRTYSSRDVLTALQRADFRRVSQRGRHVKLRGQRGGRQHTVIVKHPAAQIPVGTFRAILRQAGLTLSDFEALL